MDGKAASRFHEAHAKTGVRGPAPRHGRDRRRVHRYIPRPAVPFTHRRRWASPPGTRPAPTGDHCRAFRPQMRTGPAQRRHALRPEETTVRRQRHPASGSPRASRRLGRSAVSSAGEPWLHEWKRGQTLRIVDPGRQPGCRHHLLAATTPTGTTASPFHHVRRIRKPLLMSGEAVMLTIVAEHLRPPRYPLGGACRQEVTLRCATPCTKFMHSCRDNYWPSSAYRHRPDQGGSGTKASASSADVPVTADGQLKFDDGVSSPGFPITSSCGADGPGCWSPAAVNNPCSADWHGAVSMGLIIIAPWHADPRTTGRTRKESGRTTAALFAVPPCSANSLIANRVCLPKI